jgi:hypothetical protein
MPTQHAGAETRRDEGGSVVTPFASRKAEPRVGSLRAPLRGAC